MPQLMRTSNPVLNEKRFEGLAIGDERMTLQGTVNKTGLLLLFAVASAAWTWHQFMQSHSAAAVLPLLVDRNDRRICVRVGYRLQERMVSGDSAGLRGAGRLGTRRHLGGL